MEIVAHGGYEYRRHDGQVLRRPIETKGKTVVETAWLVLSHEPGYQVPPAVAAHFTQAQNRAAVL